jgi:hypothetical protein
MSQAVCQAIAALTQFSILASFCWTGCISITLYVICDKETTFGVESYEKYFHLISWTVPLILVAISWGLGQFGDAEIWFYYFILTI